MIKVPAAEEPVTVTLTLQELEAVAKALKLRLCNGGLGERGTTITIAALEKTRAMIDITIHRRKNRDR